jgi:hypothetical protein
MRQGHHRGGDRGYRRAGWVVPAVLLLIVVLGATSPSARARRSAGARQASTTINVPGDQPTLQAAVAAASSGDLILLAPGTYQGGVWIQDKALTIASRYYTTSDPSYIGQTIVSGYTPGYCGGDSGCAGNVVLEFGSRAGGSAVIGLTVSNGVDGVRGNSYVDISHSQVTANGDGADFGDGSGGTFTDTLFANNTDDGIDLNKAVDVRIVNNTIRDNGDDGIEFRLYPYTGPMLTTNISGNRIIHNDSDGIQLIDSPGASSRIIRIEHNLFTQQRKAAVGCMPDGNTNEDYSGAPIEERVYLINNTFTAEHYGFVGGGNTIALNNIFSGTALSALRRVAVNSISAYNLFWNNGLNYEDSVVDATTSVFVDPMLAADWTLLMGSPAIDTGTAHFDWQGATVLDLPASAYNGSAPDLGAFESAGGGPPPANTAPHVNAGLDQTVTLPADAILDATVTDDGLPNPPGAVTTSWSVDSGPGTVSFLNAGAVDTRASFSAPGVYVLSLGGNDGALTAADTIQVSVQAAPPPGASTLERRVSAGSDDAEESATGTMSLSSSDLELVKDGSNQRVGIRFANVTIPRGATITRAYVQFEADETQSEVTNLIIQGEASDSALAYTSTANNISGRPRTTSNVGWAPPPWTLVGEVGPSQRTPDLSPLIAEISNRANWQSGNALSLIITGTGHRTASAYEVKPAGAPLLHIEYDTSGGPPPPPTNTAPHVNAGLDQTVTLPADAILDATVTDDGLPNPPGAVTTSWSVDSGPGTVSFLNAGAVDTRASFSAPGVYVLSLGGNDGALTAADTIQVSVQAAPPPGASTLERRVSAGSDDAEESATGTMSLSSSDLELVKDGSNQRVGIRFANVTIPRGATITRAYVQFEADETQSEVTNLIIQGEASDSALAYTSTANNISGRPRTTSNVGWAPPPWTLVGEVGPSQRTPDLSPLIAEISNRANWQSGNALSLIITGTGHRTASAYEVKPAGAPLLHIEYDTSGGP